MIGNDNEHAFGCPEILIIDIDKGALLQLLIFNLQQGKIFQPLHHPQLYTIFHLFICTIVNDIAIY